MKAIVLCVNKGKNDFLVANSTPELLPYLQCRNVGDIIFHQQ